MMDDSKRLFRNYKNGKAGINGYLEDYAAVIEGMAKLYQVSFDEHWLMLANTLTSITLSEFYDEKEGLFFYTSNKAEELIARKKEIFDNVIPSSNALMATNLKTLGHLLSHEEYTEAARDMVDRMNRVLMLAPQDLAQWATLYALHTYPTEEVVMVTNNLAQVQALHQQYEPNKVIAGKKPQATSGLALLKGREMINSATTYFVCYNKTCQLPVNNVEDVFAQMQQASKNASQ